MDWFIGWLPSWSYSWLGTVADCHCPDLKSGLYCVSLAWEISKFKNWSMVSTECIIAFAHHKVEKSFKLYCLYPSHFTEEVWIHSEISNYSFLNSSFSNFIHQNLGFPGGSVVKNPSANAGDRGSIPGSGKSPGEGNGNPLEYSSLENSMDRGAWRAPVPGVTESDTTGACIHNQNLHQRLTKDI